MNPRSVEYLRDYNDWRREAGRYDCNDMAIIPDMPCPQEVGVAIDWACEQIERMQWIPVGERMPEPNIHVLATWKFRRPRVCYLDDRCAAQFRDSVTHQVSRPQPVAWMPIPPPPGETK